MMTKPVLSRVTKTTAAALLAVASVMVLSGCEEHPYPSPTPDESAPPAPAPPSRLMGAPDDGDRPSPPPAAYGESQAATSGPQYAEAAPPSGWPGHYRPDHGRSSADGPSAVFSMAPIPNPPESGRREQAGWRRGRHHHHHRHWTEDDSDRGEFSRHPSRPAFAHRHVHRHWAEAGYGAAAATAVVASHHHHHNHNHSTMATYGESRPHWDGGRWRWEPVGPTAPSRAHHPHRSAHVRVAPLVHPLAAGAAAAPRPMAHPAPVSRPARPHAAALQPLVPSPKPSTAATQTPASGGAPGPQSYGALQSGLSEVVKRDATLNAPAHFDANKTVDVSLTLPSGFAQTFRDQAAKQNLSEQAQSVNLDAHLVGDGFTITPDQPQSVPLTLGQESVFRWKVTPQANAKGPLHVDVSADLLSAGRNLPLGTVQSLANVGRVTGRVVGVGLLVLIVLALLGWAAQRRRPNADGATRPRSNHERGF